MRLAFAPRVAKSRAGLGSTALLVGMLLAAALAACSSGGGGGDTTEADGSPSEEAAASADAGGTGVGTEGDAGVGASDDAGESTPDSSIAHDAGGLDASIVDASIVDASVLDAGPLKDGGETSVDATLGDGSTEPRVDASLPTDAGEVPDTAAPGIDCSTSGGGAIGTSGAPLLLACTGLYGDWSTRALAAGVVPYDPGIYLWADGATKARYILLPAGTKIDTSNMDEWTFPVGTKVWKEFSLGGTKIETRYLYKTSASTWVWTTYQWSADQQTATELTAGATNVNGTTYEIPDHAKCQSCHQGRLDFVLGFEAIGLSTPAASGLTMSALTAGGWLTSPPTTPLTIPGDATASAALGWLHANCGNACHNPSKSSMAGSTGFYMRLAAANLATVQDTTTYTTGVNKASYFTGPDGGSLMLIAAGDPGSSCVIYRDGYRDTSNKGIQMPPIDTHVVDTADVAIVSKWISSL